MKQKITALSAVKNGFLAFVLLIIAAGCTTNTPVNTPVKPPQQTQNTEKSIGLSAENFTGLLTIHASNITKTETGFSVPVFLSNVTEADALDTIALQLQLGGAERLAQVKTTSGFTAQLDNMNTNKPTIYYLPSALSADAYKPVIAQKEPLFTLMFTGDIPKTMTVKGSFFIISGSIFRTNTATLAL